MKDQTPLMVISDAPTAGTGFARICNDLTTRIAQELSNEFRVCTFGYSGGVSRHLPYHQYVAQGMTGDWIMPTLPETWTDWAGEEEGIVLFLSDAARLGWFARPEMSEELNAYPILKHFLLNPPFKKWLYTPVDASGPNDCLTFPLEQILLGFDRILAYGQWGEGVIRRTLGDAEADKRSLTRLPHGIDTNIFRPYDREKARRSFFQLTGASTLKGKQEPLDPREFTVAVIGTNQARKDWGLCLEAVAVASKHFPIRLWVHTDRLERHWSLPALLVDYGLVDQTVVSLGQITDQNMACAYSACDVHLGIAPEGFGYCTFEALSCGIPSINGNYAGSPEWIPQKQLLINPVAFRYESIWSCKRPVYRAEDWAKKIVQVKENPGAYIGFLSDRLDWNGTLWNSWKRWFEKGLQR